MSLSRTFDSHWQIHRDHSGDLVYSEITDDGLSYQDDIITIEIIGLDE